MYEDELILDFPTKEEMGSLRRKRERMRKNYFRMKRLCDNTDSMFGGANYANENGDYTERENAVYMRRWYRGSNSKWIKKLCNRKFRRNSIVSSNRAIQHKATEFWWMYA